MHPLHSDTSSNIPHPGHIMAYPPSRFNGYHHPQPDSVVDRKSSFVDEDDSAVLDPSILDSDIMQQSPVATFRKGSFAASTGVLTPAESHTWDHQFMTGVPVDPNQAGAAMTYHGDGNMFVQPPSSSQPTPFTQASLPVSWNFDQGSGDCTPATAADFMPPPLPRQDAAAFRQRRVDSARGSFSQPTGPHQQTSSFYSDSHPDAFIPTSQGQAPLSPHSHSDWMGFAQQEAESRPLNKRMRAHSPPRSIDFRGQPNSIRKKNGRIEIPEDRNIHNIDFLIERATDNEELVKELKQQKRLLRNREAALASRQRKKKHTEDLECKEKGYTQQIAILEQKLSALSVRNEHLQKNFDTLCDQYSAAQRAVEGMHVEKRDLTVKHNEELATLRKKVNLLNEIIETGPAPNMSAAPSSAGYSEFTADMGNLNMEPIHEWDSYFNVNAPLTEHPADFPTFDSHHDVARPVPTLEKKSSSMTITPDTVSKSNDNHTDQPIASSLLFMLLLCGAFIASQPPNSKSVAFPKMPSAVRAAAPTVLNNLLTEHNNAPDADYASRVLAGASHEPLASGVAPSYAGSSRLEQMHQSITSPTKRQEMDTAFALTPAQYASITGMEVSGQTSNDLTPHPRRSLAQALASVEKEHSRPHKMELYSRSLLWNQIPEDVVAQFKEMVRDRQALEAREHHETDEQHAYKLEL